MIFLFSIGCALELFVHVRQNSMKFLIFFISICTFANAANILAVWPVVSRTQFSLGMVLLHELAEKGHNVS